MIGERGIVPAEPSVREEGVHPGAPAVAGAHGRGAARALVAATFRRRVLSVASGAWTRALALYASAVRGCEVLFERLVRARAPRRARRCQRRGGDWLSAAPPSG